MLKKRDLFEVNTLYELAIHPEVKPYIRQSTESAFHFYQSTEEIMHAELNGELISRTIINEDNDPIGTINLYDIQHDAGFLATWIGQAYFGKGYNRAAKEAFLFELFYQTNIDTVFVKIRKNNFRSIQAASKLAYIEHANETYPFMYAQTNQIEDLYHLLVITKENFFQHMEVIPFVEHTQTINAEDVS